MRGGCSSKALYQLPTPCTKLYMESVALAPNSSKLCMMSAAGGGGLGRLRSHAFIIAAVAAASNRFLSNKSSSKRPNQKPVH